MDITKSLESIGLSERESRVYLVLLDIGPTTTSKLIRKTGIASSKIYDVLEKLAHKGLVTYVLVKGKKEFHPINPEKLYDLLKEKEKTIDEILSELKDLYKKTSKEVIAEIYKGKEGIKTVFDDIMKEKRDWYVLGASGKGATTLPYYLPHFYDKLEKSKIKTKILFVDAEETKKQFKDLKKYKKILVGFLPKEIRNLMVTFIYGDRVVIIPITPLLEIEPLAIMIKSKESAESHRDYFDWIWKLSKK